MQDTFLRRLSLPNMPLPTQFPQEVAVVSNFKRSTLLHVLFNLCRKARSEKKHQNYVLKSSLMHLWVNRKTFNWTLS